ncbi:MAG: hypothetical protein Q7T82_15530 [Armatimonadota bacterium]|nr:hypothetical protein [Armatimonadota bacterium]
MTNDRIPKWPLIASAVAIALVAALVLAMQSANRTPIVKIPTPVLPSPNAYDHYASAVGMMKGAEKVGFAVDDSPRPRVSPMQPGVPAPAPPSAQPPPGSPAPSVALAAAPRSNPLDHVYSLAEKEVLVRANAAALKELRRGLAYDYRRPPARSFNATYPEFAKFRSLARALVLEGQTKAGRGDRGGAMNSHLDAVRFGADIPKGGDIIDMLVGCAIQSIGRNGAWKSVDTLNAEQARRAAAYIETIMSRGVPFAETLQEAKWCTQASLIQMFKGPGWRHNLFAWVEADSRPDIKVKTLFMSKRGIFSRYAAYTDECIANARKPYAVSKAWPRQPNDPVSLLLCPVFGKARFAAVKNEAQNGILAVTLALRAYRLEHGKYPASLAEIAPGYLKKIPNDPFAAGGPLKYKPTGGKYVLYSLGPDCKDNGGASIGGPVTPTVPLDHRTRYAQADSKGDMVAGINP